MSKPEVDLSIIIVNWNTKKLLMDCLFSIYKTVCDVSFEVRLVDNASTDDSVKAVRQNYPDVNIVVNQQNMGFAAANNMALKVMKGRYALLLNTDTVLTDCAVKNIYTFMENRPGVGMACGQLINEDGSKQNSIANFPSLLSIICNETLLRLVFPENFPSKHQNYIEPIMVDSCIGACLMVRKEAIDQVGPLDERYFFFMEETDWALMMKNHGWMSWFVPDSRVFHLQGQSAGDNIGARKMFFRSRYLYLKKWHLSFFPIFKTAIVIRLVLNFLLNLLAVTITIGCVGKVRRKYRTYSGLLWWHIKGCPG